MEQSLLKILAIAYGSVGIIGFLAYFPTVRDLYFYKKPSANVSSYALWCSTNCVAFLYGIFILKDFLFQFVCGLNLFACFTVLILRLRIKAVK